MTTKKRRDGGKKKAVMQVRSLSELAHEMSVRRDKVESLLKDFALLLYGRESGETRWHSANILQLFYCDDILLTIGVRPDSLVVGLSQNQKGNYQKKILNNVEELEIFLLKLYDGWNKPKPKQKPPKKRK